MRKLILKWLFGTANVEKYFKLLVENDMYLASYVEEIREHRDDLVKHRNSIDEHIKTLNDARKLVKICENHGIDVDKEIKEIEL